MHLLFFGGEGGGAPFVDAESLTNLTKKNNI